MMTVKTFTAYRSKWYILVIVYSLFQESLAEIWISSRVYAIKNQRGEWDYLILIHSLLKVGVIFWYLIPISYKTLVRNGRKLSVETAQVCLLSCHNAVFAVKKTNKQTIRIRWNTCIKVLIIWESERFYSCSQVYMYCIEGRCSVIERKAHC